MRLGIYKIVPEVARFGAGTDWSCCRINWASKVRIRISADLQVCRGMWGHFAEAACVPPHLSERREVAGPSCSVTWRGADQNDRSLLPRVDLRTLTQSRMVNAGCLALWDRSKRCLAAFCCAEVLGHVMSGEPEHAGDPGAMIAHALTTGMLVSCLS